MGDPNLPRRRESGVFPSGEKKTNYQTPAAVFYSAGGLGQNTELSMPGSYAGNHDNSCTTSKY